MNTIARQLASLPFVLALLAPLGIAQVVQTGSLVVFPEYDTRTGHSTPLTVTNSRGPTITVEFVYVNSANCTEFNLTFALTPLDTRTVLSAPSGQRGYVYAFVKDAATGAAISVNNLAGVETHLDAVASLSYSIEPFVFQAIPPPGSPTDVDGDGVRDLNGIEYAPVPDKLVFPRFVGDNAAYHNELILINLTGTQFTTTVSILAANDNEELFSSGLNFGCWARLSLASVSSLFTQSFLLSTNQNVNESYPGNLETGWFQLDGVVASSSAATVNGPALLAVLLEPAQEHLAELPFGRGTQTNGDLLPTGLLPDTN
jgi:hypothetical protein